MLKKVFEVLRQALSRGRVFVRFINENEAFDVQILQIFLVSASKMFLTALKVDKEIIIT